jgi:hypothetical protein
MKSLKHGTGADYFNNGDMYKGHYTLGKHDGYGEYKWNNGANYIGEFKSGKKHGKGRWR